MYPTSPVPGSSHWRRQGSRQHQFRRWRQIERTRSLNITDALQQNVPGITVNDVAGNPFQPNCQFRGFVASPVAGTPQGLAVYQNGVRINEAFGDTVNWDLIPTTAIKSLAVVTNNPAFGLNALGGAVNLQMKDGFGYHGAEIDTMGGSFGRIQSSAQWGKQIDNLAVYGALEGMHDNGFRNFSASDVRRFYGDVGYRNDGSEFHLNMGVADNNFGATTTVPVELLQQYWGATYTSPQTTDNRVGYLNLTGKVEATPTWTIDGSRMRGRSTSKPWTAIRPARSACDRRCDAALLWRRQHAGERPQRSAACQSVRSRTRCWERSIAPRPIEHRRRLAAGDQHRSVVRARQSLRRRHKFRLQRHAFRRQRRTRHDRHELRRQRQRHLPRAIRQSRSRSGRSRCGPPINIAGFTRSTPSMSRMRSRSPRAAASTTRALRLQDQLGTALNGNDTFDRFNPIIGGTYKITPELTAYAGYSEANRAPTPLELGCADPGACPASSQHSWSPIRR